MFKKFASSFFIGVLTLAVQGQCLDRSTLQVRINYLKDSSRAPIKERIAELNSYLRNIDHCPYREDSTHAYLLRTIGVLFRFEADYLNAARYFRESVDLILRNADKSSISRQP